jgi:N6-adenosine-specific RNA methylase IME4
MRGRPATRKKGAYTPAERARRYRQRLKRSRPDPKTVAKQQRRAERETMLAAATQKVAQLLGLVLYGVLYIDPPWDFLVYSRQTGMDRHAANHYPVMSLDALAALKLPAAKDCVLYLWAPVAQLRNALWLIEQWGFTYKSAHIWAKPGQGTGHIVLENAELLLVASRGNPAWPAPGEQFRSLVIEAARAEPSEKPDAFAEMIEQLWPRTAKCEMFARKPRAGWDVWGNEVSA